MRPPPPRLSATSSSTCAKLPPNRRNEFVKPVLQGPSQFPWPEYVAITSGGKAAAVHVRQQTLAIQ